MSPYEEVRAELRAKPQRFLVTGAAGFIGSHLVSALVGLGQSVVGVDDFSTGNRANLEDVLGRRQGPAVFPSFRLIEGDIRDPAVCLEATRGVDIVLHEAALASVPRSMKDPRSTHSVNVDGFVNVALAAREAGVRRIVFASSSSVYGDDAALPKTEARTGRPLSPYAATKVIDEVYAGTFRRTFGIESVGLRYFNVFGPRQDPAGPYAAVIPRWVESLLAGEPCVVFGDGTASRDFCYVDNVVQANLLAACSSQRAYDVFNVACGARTTLAELFAAIRRSVARYQRAAERVELRFGPARPGDIPHSFASIERAADVLGYVPTHDLARGMDETIAWYARARGRTGEAGSPGASPTPFIAEAS